jgi:hypothetical protein
VLVVDNAMTLGQAGPTPLLLAPFANAVNVEAWTGAASPTAGGTVHCNGWTATSGTGTAGQSWHRESWFNSGPQGCNTSQRLYCLEQ